MSNVNTRVHTLSIIAWLRLARVFQKIDRASTCLLRTWNLSPAQFDVLVQLSKAEGITQQELADRLLVTKGNICQLLGRLEERKLLTRQQDGRANRLFLTAEGHRLLEESLSPQEALIASQFEALTEQELAQLLALVRKLDHALE